MRPLRQCWRTWTHPQHLHMGPRGNEPMARCAGVRPQPACPEWMHKHCKHCGGVVYLVTDGPFWWKHLRVPDPIHAAEV